MCDPAATGCDATRLGDARHCPAHAAKAACEAALTLVERWDEGWHGAVKYGEGAPERHLLAECADELLQALSLYVMPMVEAAGVVPFVGHEGTS